MKKNKTSKPEEKPNTDSREKDYLEKCRALLFSNNQMLDEINQAAISEINALHKEAFKTWAKDLERALKIKDETKFLEKMKKADAKYYKVYDPVLECQLKYAKQAFELGLMYVSQTEYAAFENEFLSCREKNVNKKITRGISDNFVDAFVSSKLYSLYNSNQKDLFIGIRNEYINLYYNAASVCKVTYDSRRNKLNCITAKKYLGFNEKGYKTLSAEDLIKNYKEIKSTIEKKYSPDEKTAQQRLVYKNNSNKKSKWFCIDIEYVKQRYSKEENLYGRFDIIAISKDKPHRVALIELKYGTSAIGGKSGVVKHATDFISFIREDIYAKHLKKEAMDIVNCLNKLNICPIHIKDEKELEEKPEFYFITLNNEKDEARRKMRRYVLKDCPGASSHNVEKECKVNITKPNVLGCALTFLFSDNKVENIIIDDIIESKLYSRVL